MNEKELARLIDDLRRGKPRELDLRTKPLVGKPTVGGQRDDSQMTRLLNALSTNTSVTALNLSGQKVTRADMLAAFLCLKSTAPRRLREVILARTSIGDKELFHLCHALKKNNVPIGTFDLSGNKITAEGAEEIGKMLMVNNSISSLTLSSNKIGPMGCKKISAGMVKRVQKIEHLEIANCDIGDAGACEIARMIENNPSLLTINLSYNRITDKGALLIAQALETNSRITSINLSKNIITDMGGKMLQRVLQYLPNLKEINLDGNQLSFEVREALLKYMESDDNKSGRSTVERPNIQLNDPKLQVALKTNDTISGLLFYKTDLARLLFDEARNNGIKVESVSSPADLRKAINEKVMTSAYDKELKDSLMYIINKADILAEGYPKDFYEKIMSIRRLNTPENKKIINQLVDNIFSEYKTLFLQGAVLGTELELLLASDILQARINIYVNDNIVKTIGLNGHLAHIDVAKGKYQYRPYITSKSAAERASMNQTNRLIRAFETILKQFEKELLQSIQEKLSPLEKKMAQIETFLQKKDSPQGMMLFSQSNLPMASMPLHKNKNKHHL